MIATNLRLVLMTTCLAILPGAVRAQPAARPEAGPAEVGKIDPAQAKAEFESASKAMRDLVTRLTTLQADYQKPGSDKSKIEAEFNAEQAKGQALSEKLETSAVALAMVSPKDAEAREVATAVIAGSLDADDPRKAV